MVGVLLFILKLIGILLLCALGLILFLLLAVLLVPVRYGANLTAADKKASGYVKVHWFLHIIDVRLDFRNTETDLKIRLAGFRIKRGGRKKAKEENKRRKEKPKSAGTFESPKQETLQPQEPSLPKAVEAQQERDRQLIEEASGQEQRTFSQDPLEENERQTVQEEKPRKEEREKKSSFSERLERIKETILQKADRIRDSLRNLQSKKDWITSLAQELRSDEMRPSVNKVISGIKKLIRHIFPRRGNAELTIGFDNPAVTGQVLGILAMLYPAFRGGFTVTPCFDRAVFEAKISCKGRIRLGTLLILLIRIVLDKRIRAFVTKARKGGR